MHFPDRCQKRRERKGLCHSNGMSRRMESKNYKLFSWAVTYKSCCLINKIWHSTCVIEYRKQVALPCGLKWERTGFCGSTFSLWFSCQNFPYMERDWRLGLVLLDVYQLWTHFSCVKKLVSWKYLWYNLSLFLI